MLDADIIPRFPSLNVYEIEAFVLIVEELRYDTAFLSLPTHEKARKLNSRYRSLKKHGNKVSRREKILTLVSDTNKLVRRYVRAYPEKQQATK